jgi:ribosome-associated protein
MLEAPLEVTRTVAIPRDELQVTFARSGGPGGQNVNKVSSKVVLRFSVRDSRSLTPEEKARVLEKAPPRYLTKEGELVIAASEYRDQAQNRAAAETRLVACLREALAKERTRRPTRPGKGARARRRDSKERQSEKKSGRRARWD